MERKYKTVNGIKVKLIDEKTRKVIERAGDVEAQVKKASHLGVLDREFYDKIMRGLRTERVIKMLVFIGVNLSYATLYYNLSLLTICTIFNG